MLTQFPIENDSRYTITKEFIGYPDARFVLRFCGEFVAQSEFYSVVLLRAIGEDARRRGALVLTEVTDKSS